MIVDHEAVEDHYVERDVPLAILAKRHCFIRNAGSRRMKSKFGQLIDASFRPFFRLLTWTDRQTDQQAYFPKETQFYISVMFLGFPNKFHKEKPSFLDFENNWLRTDGRTDRPTDGQTLL